MTTVKVKVTVRVLEWLNNTGTGKEIADLLGPGQLTNGHLADPKKEWDLAMMILKTRASPMLSDGSMWPALTEPEIRELREYADYFLHYSRHPANSGDMNKLGDVNAARAQIRRCDAAFKKLERVEARRTRDQ